MNHDHKVTELYLEANNVVEENNTFWDGVVRELEYFENYEDPLDSPEVKGKCVGEADVFLFNETEKVGVYKEVKPHKGEFSYAEEQIERMDEFFDDWSIYGQKFVYRSDSL